MREESALPEFETLLYDVDEHVATISLNQPDTRNALSAELLTDLIAAFEAARDDEEARCVVLTSIARDARSPRARTWAASRRTCR